MSDPVASAILIRARNEAMIACADQGTAPSTIEIYDAPDLGGVRLATVVLAKPCGVINTAGLLKLTQADSAGDFVEFDGIPASASWLNGLGQELMRMTAGKKGSGAHVELDSRTGGDLYAGGRVVLVDGWIG